MQMLIIITFTLNKYGCGNVTRLLHNKCFTSSLTEMYSKNLTTNGALLF